MKCIKRSVPAMLSILLLLTSFPAASFASSDIWPGYPGADQLPAINTIPDPFKFFDVKNDPTGDGYVSNPSEWNARRNEIKDLVQRYWLGYRWPTDPNDVVGETNVVMEPNQITVGFNWPPYSYPTTFNLKDEFDKLVEKLLTNKVEIHELIPGTWGSTTEGAVKFTFGPAENQEEAEALAIEAWNSGYYLPYTSFGLTYHAVFKNYTGELSAPPPAEVPVTYHTVTVTNPDSGATSGFNINVTTPSAAQMTTNWGSADVQAPAIIDIGGTLSQGQVEAVKEQGYAYIRFNPTDIYPDDSSSGDGINRDGVYTRLYPYNKDVYEYASGALMAWSWGASQIISALESTTGSSLTWGQKLNVDPTRTLVTGHSRYGKAALFAAAFDDRFDICLASEPGGSGIQSYRYKVEGKIFNFNTYPKADRVYGKTEIPTVSYGGGSSWFPETAGHFVNKDNKLPFDSSDIISLVAPRPFLTTTGIDAHWLGNEGAVAAVQAASEVYAYIGNNEIEKTNIAIRARESDHALYNRDLPFVIAIMDREFKQTDNKKLHVKDLFPSGDGSATGNVKDYGTLGSMSYPAKDYDYIDEFNSYPFDINSSYLPWSRPDKYTLWTAQENFLVGHPVTITAHSNAPDVKLYLPDGTEVNASRHEGEIFTFNLSASQAVYGRYELRTAGGAKENRSVFFAAVSLADSLRHATSKGDEGEENRLIGFSSRLANNSADPPEVYVGGSTTPVSMSFTPERFKAEETTLLEYGIQFHDKLFARIANEGWDESKTFHIKNLKFVTIPGFTFEISFGNIYASAANSGKDGANRFTQPISWNVERYNNGPAKDWPVIPDTKAEKEIVLAGGTVSRPIAPAPKSAAFDTKIINTAVQRAGNKTNVVINFDEELDTREFGFGINVANEWDTAWSEDKKQVTLSMDYNKFPAGSNADIIIFRLKDAEGNMLPGPIYLTLSHPKPADSGPDTSPAAPAPPIPPVLPQSSVLSMMPVLDNSGVGAARLDEKKAAELLSKNITIILPEMEGASAYGVNLPTTVLSGAESSGMLTVSSKIGKLAIPGNMLQGASGIGGKEVGVAIGEGDKAKLPADVKAALGDKPLIRLSFSVDGKQAEWNNPNAPVTVSIPYTPTPEELKNPENIVVWYIDGSGKVSTIPNGRYDAGTGMVVFKTTHFSLYAVAYVKKAFTDLAGAEWARKQAEVLAAKDIIKTSGNTFNPSAGITRAEFLYSLVRALGIDATVGGNFDDIAKDSYYYKEIAAAKALGIANGVGGNKLGAESIITRQDMMAMTERALRLLKKIKQQGSASELDRFSDKSAIAPYAASSVATIVKEGLIAGSNGMINPAGKASRAEAAVFLYRVYNKY